MINPLIYIVIIAVMIGLAFPLPFIGNIGSFIFDPVLGAFGLIGIGITFNTLYVLLVVVLIVYFARFTGGW